MRPRRGSGYKHYRPICRARTVDKRAAQAPRFARVRVGVLASGSGTNLRAILDHGIPVVVVLADRPLRRARRGTRGRRRGRADRAGRLLGPASIGSRTRTASSTRSSRHGVELIAMAGFGTILEKPIHDAFPDRILNTHPALLPAFKGWHTVPAALAAGVKITGCTVHVATLEVDDGPILAQEAVPVLDGDTVESLARTDQGGRAPVVSRSDRTSRPRVRRGTGAGPMRVKIRRALLSVSDKTGIEALALALHELGVELISSSNTAAAIAAAGVPVTPISDVTGFPEILDHRVVTLNPRVHGGLLADLGNPEHVAELEPHDIAPIELVVSNLYPFRERPDIETIDIGGPAMTRAVGEEPRVGHDRHRDRPVRRVDRGAARQRRNGRRRKRATRSQSKRSPRTAAYDAAIVEWLQGTDESAAAAPRARARADRRAAAVRREPAPAGGARYREVGAPGFWDSAVKHGDFALSYLNFYDAEAAWRLVHDLGERPHVRDRQARQPVRCRRRRTSSPRRTAWRSSATTSRRSAASSRSTGRRRRDRRRDDRRRRRPTS